MLEELARWLAFPFHMLTAKLRVHELGLGWVPQSDRMSGIYSNSGFQACRPVSLDRPRFAVAADLGAPRLEVPGLRHSRCRLEAAGFQKA